MNYLYNVRSFKLGISREMLPSFPTPYTGNRQGSQTTAMAKHCEVSVVKCLYSNAEFLTYPCQSRKQWKPCSFTSCLYLSNSDVSSSLQLIIVQHRQQSKHAQAKSFYHSKITGLLLFLSGRLSHC